MAMILAACGGTAGEAPTPAEGAPTESAPEPGGDLRVVLVSEPRALHRGLDNTLASTGVAGMIVEDLVASDSETLQPTKDGLVSDWARVDDLTWTFTVRDGVSFHNDEMFTAEVAAFNILRSRDDATGSTAPYFELIDDAVAIDQSTIEVKTTVPVPFLPTLLTIVQVFPPEYFDEVGNEEFGRHPIGTGPFVFDSWEPGQNITVARNDAYHDGAPLLDTVTFTWAAESSTRLSLLQTGEADIVTKLPPTDAVTLGDTEEFTVHQVTSLLIMHLYFNVADPPLDDVRVRKAIAHAIDRDLLVESIFDGDGAVATTDVYQPIFSSAGGHGEDYLSYDPDRARSLLDEAGEIGPIDFHWPVGRYLLDNEVGEAVTGMLEEVGFQINRQPAEATAYFDLLFTNEMTGIHLLGGGVTFAHEDGALSSKFKTTGVITYCADERVDQLAAQALQLEEGAERDAAYNEIERFLLTEHVCPVPLYLEVDSYATSDRVVGFEPRNNESWDQLRSVGLTD